MKYQMIILSFYLSLLIITLIFGCSSRNPYVIICESAAPILDTSDSRYLFPDIPKHTTPYRDLSSVPFELNHIQKSIDIEVSNHKRFELQYLNGNVSIYNPGTIVYDLRLIVNSDTEDGNDGIDFGIVPGGMKSISRFIGSDPQWTTNQLRIDYKDRAFIHNERIRLHASEFTSQVERGVDSGLIVSNTCLVGCDDGIEVMYPILLRHDLLLTGIIEPLNLYRVQIPDNRSPYEVVDLLNREPSLNNAEVESCVKPAYFPDDPIYDPSQPSDYRWAFERIDAVDAWDYYSDKELNQSGDASVSGIVLAILDTGLTPHEDLGLTQSDISLILHYSKNFVSPGSHVLDMDGHGTAVAGIMGAKGNNQIGMAGMAWDPIFLPLKVFVHSDEFGQVGPLFNLLQGLMYVRDLAGVAPFFKFIVNMSLGGYEQTPSYWTTEAVRRTDNRNNTLLIAAAGNDKNDSSFANVPFAISADNYYPAALDRVVSVAASSYNTYNNRDREVFEEDSLMWGTNWGLTVDFCAPGSRSIYTAGRESASHYVTDFGGTSASAAFVTGLAALIWSDIPSLTKQQVKSRIATMSDPMHIPSNKNGKLGTGRINAYKAVRGTKPVAVINDISWTREGDPLFGDALHLSGDGIFTDPSLIPPDGSMLNFRWYVNNDFTNPIAYGRNAIYYQLPEGTHTIHLRVWNKGQEWNFWNPNHFSDPVEWSETINIQDSPLPDDYFTWIYIPDGEFIMGCGTNDPFYNNSGTWDEKPQHVHYVPPFFIRKYEMTNIEYNAFIEAGGYDNPDYWQPEGWDIKTQNNWQHPLYWIDNQYKGGNPIDFPEHLAHPVIGISWWEADAFSTWAGHRLPTESQWEKAARGSEDDRTYPWGYEWNQEYLNCNSDSTTPHATAVVGTYSPEGDSPYGLADMAGNVWEWCWEWYEERIYERFIEGDYTLPETGVTKSCRGGGWYYTGEFTTRCASRYSLALPSTSRKNYIGFRTVYGGD